MTYRGRVQNGVIVIEGNVQLPEGTVVTVEAVEEASEGKGEKRPIDIKDDPIYRIAELAMPTGIPDLSVNIDHYLYGHPKVGEEEADEAS